MKKNIIVIGGYPGSGKSSVKSILAERLGYKAFSAGDFTRHLAEERGMTLEAFNEYVAEHGEEIDHLIDEEQKRIEAEDSEYIVDAHVGFHFIPSGFKVFLYTPIETSAKRIFNDKDAEIRIKSGDIMDSYEEALERTQKRVDNHKVRYQKHYGVDVYDEKHFDLVIDTSELTPPVVADMIEEAFNTWLKS
jgi:CMP/dCMP kinase